MSARGKLTRQLAVVGFGLVLWLLPPPGGLLREPWHLFAVFAAAIFSVILDAFPLMTAAVLAAAITVLTGTVAPAKVFSGFANGSVLLVVIAFLVARSVVKSGLGRRISLVVGLRVRPLDAWSRLQHILDRRAHRARLPSNTARAGVLFPIVLSLAQGAGSRPEDGTERRVGAYLMLCGMVSLSVSSALWLTATSANPIGVEIAPRLRSRDRLRLLAPRRVRPGAVGDLGLAVDPAPTLSARACATPDAPAAARAQLSEMRALSRDEKVVAAVFAALVVAWAGASTLKIDSTASRSRGSARCSQRGS